jgi:hypothetical protein
MYHTIFVAGVVSDQENNANQVHLVRIFTILEALVNKMNRVSVLDVFIRSSITGITRANEEKKMYAIGKKSAIEPTTIPLARKSAATTLVDIQYRTRS